MPLDWDDDNTPQAPIRILGFGHRLICTAASIAALVVLIRVVIVAAPGYNFRVLFNEPEILTELDSWIIRGSSILCILPLLILTPLLTLSLFSRAHASMLDHLLEKWTPFMNWLDRRL